MLAVNHVPLRYALGKGGTALALLAPVAAAVLSLLVGLWSWGLRQYQSAGS
jgi:ABC-type uncharacterized transport system permease subunit